MGDGGKKAPPLFFCGDIGFKREGPKVARAWRDGLKR
jgi:hypothetical protein